MPYMNRVPYLHPNYTGCPPEAFPTGPGNEPPIVRLTLARWKSDPYGYAAYVAWEKRRMATYPPEPDGQSVSKMIAECMEHDGDNDYLAAVEARALTRWRSYNAEGLHRSHRLWRAFDKASNNQIVLCGCTGHNHYVWRSTFREVGDGSGVCDRYQGDLSSCENCEKLYRAENFDLYRVRVQLADGSGYRYVCSFCRDTSGALRCDECGIWHEPASTLHNHPPRCGHNGFMCEAPEQTFRVPNMLGDPVPNDTRVDVRMTAEEVSGQGIEAIASAIAAFAVASGVGPYAYHRGDAIYHYQDVLNTLGRELMTKEGSYAKRVSRHLYRSEKVKLTPEVLTEIGNLAARHSSQQPSFRLEFSRRLNRSAREFVNDGSCWWGSYVYSRCTLKQHGGMVCLDFDPDRPTARARGRIWIMPLTYNAEGDYSDWETTHDLDVANAYVLFNGYGTLVGNIAARLLSDMTGLGGWCDIGFRCNRDLTQPSRLSQGDQSMYINGQRGQLVSTPEVCNNTTAVNLVIDPHPAERPVENVA